MSKIAYQDKWVTLYHGDCRGMMDGLPTNLGPLRDVDAIITDPPYAETSYAWDKWPDGWPALAMNVTNSLWCFGSLRMFMDRRHDFLGWNLSQDIVWEKHNGSSMARDRFRRVHEMAAHFYYGDWARIHKSPVMVEATTDRGKGSATRSKSPPHWNGVRRPSTTYTYGGQRLQRSVIKERSCHGYAIHPTQKPEAIIAPLIEYSVAAGGLVLDPFAGSSTTLVVARRMGRRAIGIEADPETIKRAVTRLEGKTEEAAA